MVDRSFERERRQLLVGAGSLVAVAVAGCLGDEEAPDPVTIGEVACAECGMVVPHHPGPSGQAFYEEEIPEGSDAADPAYFCSSHCAYSFVFDRRDEGHEPLVLYLTDYSGVDWEVSMEAGTSFLSVHLDAEDHGNVDDLVLVVNSDVYGSMGPAMVPFSNSEDAEAFIDEYGGETVTHDEVDRDLLAALRN